MDELMPKLPGPKNPYVYAQEVLDRRNTSKMPIEMVYCEEKLQDLKSLAKAYMRLKEKNDKYKKFLEWGGLVIFCDRCRIGKFELGKPCPVCGGVGTGQTVTIPDLAKKYALHQKTKGAKLDTAKLAEDHWGYVASVLKSHGEADDVIEKCGHHYKTAFIHGYKHAREAV